MTQRERALELAEKIWRRHYDVYPPPNWEKYTADLIEKALNEAWKEGYLLRDYEETHDEDGIKTDQS